MERILIFALTMILNIQKFAQIRNPGRAPLENEPEGTPFLSHRWIERKRKFASMVLR